MSIHKLWRTFFKVSPLQVLVTGCVMLGLFAGTLYSHYFKRKSSSSEVEAILHTMPGGVINPVIDSQKTTIRSADQVAGYYSKINHAFVWISVETRTPNQAAYTLVERIGKCYLEGLNPNSYHFEEISTLFALIHKHPHSSMDKAVLAFLDVLLTDAYITYTGHQYAGQIHTNVFNTSWNKHIMEITPMDSLKKLEAGISMDKVLDGFICPYPDYMKLQNILKVLCENEIQTAPTREKIRLISLNMERWRWLERENRGNYLMANTADFTMKIVCNGSDTLPMKIITGKLQQPTPVFEAKLSYLVINPWWEVPSTIARKEMLPEIKRDRTYLEKNHLKLYKAGIETDPGNMKWDTITPRNFSYKLRQTPGPWNALGAVKFIFPNKHNIYFHDTPQRDLFGKQIRTFSHGCIRVEKPVSLVALLLNKDEDWVLGNITNNQEKLFPIPDPPMVFICYWTMWVNDSGELCSAPDIYGYDKELDNLINQTPPESYDHLLVEATGF